MRTLYGDVKGVYNIGELIHHNKGAHGLQPETQAYIDRVTADGGVVIDPISVNNAFLFFSNEGLEIAAAWAADWGVKKNAPGQTSKWYSLAGAYSDLAQVNGVDQPIWVANQQNGLPALTINGTSQNMAKAFTLAQPTIVFMVAKAKTWVSGANVIDGFASGSGALYQITSTPNVNMYDGAAALNAFVSFGVLNTFNQVSCKFKQNDHYYRLNGTNLAGSQAGGTLAMSGLTLGKQGGASAGYFNGDYGEIIILNQETSLGANIETYLKDKWGTP